MNASYIRSGCQDARRAPLLRLPLSPHCPSVGCGRLSNLLPRTFASSSRGNSRGQSCCRAIRQPSCSHLLSSCSFSAAPPHNPPPPPSLSLPSLPRLPIANWSISVGGFAPGGDMAIQVHVAFSCAVWTHAALPMRRAALHPGADGEAGGELGSPVLRRVPCQRPVRRPEDHCLRPLPSLPSTSPYSTSPLSSTTITAALPPSGCSTPLVAAACVSPRVSPPRVSSWRH